MALIPAAEAKQHGDHLLGKLRRFSADHVKISARDQEWARGLVDDILKGKVFKLCQERSRLPISHFEYTGSVYERLKTEAADEVDVMVVLKTNRREVVAETAVPGYVLLKVEDKSSPLIKYANPDGFLIPEKFRSAWFTSLVTTVVQDIKKEPSLAVNLKTKSHGPAIQLDISEEGTEKLLSCDLVPSFRMGNNFYVAKPYPEHGGSNLPCDRRLVWRQSFSLREKARLAEMDKEDHGCRHELLRIVKTIIRSEPTFSKLTTYHLKTAFLRYDEKPRNWDRDQLAERFTEYLGTLLEALEKKKLSHFWVPGSNLLEGIETVTLKNMEDRLRRILSNSKDSLTKILQQPVAQGADSLNERVCEQAKDSRKQPQTDVCAANQPAPKTSQEDPDVQNQLRKFIVDQSKPSSDASEWGKTVVEKFVRKKLVEACKQKSAILNNLEFSGNLYEGLKSETPDSDDVTILLVLKTKKNDVTSERRGEHVIRLQAGEGSVYAPYADSQGYISHVKIASTFSALFQATAAGLSGLPVKFKVVKRDSFVELKIDDSPAASLLVNLVPAFLISGDYFSASRDETSGDPTIWVKNFALDVKRELQSMGRVEQGCRRDLLKIAKAVIRREPTFEPVTTHKLKMAFLGFREAAKDWGNDALYARFVEFLEYLRSRLESGVLAHYWRPEVNLLADVQSATLGNMASRLQRILRSEQERSKVLGALCSYL